MTNIIYAGLPIIICLFFVYLGPDLVVFLLSQNSGMTPGELRFVLARQTPHGSATTLAPQIDL